MKWRVASDEKKASMYGLRKDIDLKFLNGRECVQIAIGVYQIQFGFDEDVRIRSKGSLATLTAELRWCGGLSRVLHNLRRAPWRSLAPP
jgi:hypothetical protein